jgi:hypothetical protein
VGSMRECLYVLTVQGKEQKRCSENSQNFTPWIVAFCLKWWWTLPTLTSLTRCGKMYETQGYD